MSAIVTLSGRSVAAASTVIAETPVSASTIGTPPARVAIRFDASPGTESVAFRLIDTGGATILDGIGHASTHDPTTFGLALPRLAPGRYTVAWTVAVPEAADIQGAYSFTLTDGLGPAAPADPQPAAPIPTSFTARPVPDTLIVALRSLRDGTLAGLFGVFGVAVFVLWPICRSRRDDGAWRRGTAFLHRWALGCIFLFLLANGIMFAAQAATLAGTGLLTVPRATLRLLFTHTVYGDTWRIAMECALVLLLGIASAPLLHRQSARGNPMEQRRVPLAPQGETPSVWPWWLGLAVTTMLAVASALSSNAVAGMHAPVLTLLAASSYLVAIGLWIGGFGIAPRAFAAAFGQRSPRNRAVLLRGVHRRMAPLTLGCMIILAITGLIAVGPQVRLADLFTTRSGAVVLGQQSLVLLLALLCVARFLIVTGRDRRIVVHAFRWLPRIMRAEVVLGIGLVCVSALLAQLPATATQLCGNAAAADLSLAVTTPVLDLVHAADADLTSGPQETATFPTPDGIASLQVTTGRDGSVVAIIPPARPSDAALPVAQRGVVQDLTVAIHPMNDVIAAQDVSLTREADGWYRALRA